MVQPACAGARTSPEGPPLFSQRARSCVGTTRACTRRRRCWCQRRMFIFFTLGCTRESGRSSVPTLRYKHHAQMRDPYTC
eukprot:3695710-Pleurochrysis_carterae.AAC.1